MSILKVNTIQDKGGNAIISSDGSGTLTLPSDLKNTPAWDVQMSSQTLSDNVQSKLQFDTEILDTDSAYDSSTNYRFTVPSGKGGVYLVYLKAVSADNGDAVLISYNYGIFKNGTAVKRSYTNFTNNYVDSGEGTIVALLSLSAGDYVEAYGTINTTGAGPNMFSGIYSSFGGYRIIGA